MNPYFFLYWNHNQAKYKYISIKTIHKGANKLNLSIFLQVLLKIIYIYKYFNVYMGSSDIMST